MEYVQLKEKKIFLDLVLKTHKEILFMIKIMRKFV